MAHVWEGAWRLYEKFPEAHPTKAEASAVLSKLFRNGYNRAKFRVGKYVSS